jgi:hypothetical protein
MTYRLFLQHLSDGLLIVLPQQHHLASLFLTSSTCLLSDDIPTVSAASQRWSAHTAPPAAPSCVSPPLSASLAPPFAPPSVLSVSPVHKFKNVKFMFFPVLWIRTGLMRIRIQLFISMRMWIGIQRAKPMRIHADPDPGQTLKS